MISFLSSPQGIAKNAPGSESRVECPSKSSPAPVASPQHFCLGLASPQHYTSTKISLLLVLEIETIISINTERVHTATNVTGEPSKFKADPEPARNREMVLKSQHLPSSLDRLQQRPRALSSTPTSHTGSLPLHQLVKASDRGHKGAGNSTPPDGGQG